jgi:hypothetical protein
VLTVDVGQATDQEFKLAILEDLDELLRHDLIEPLKEVVDLLLDGVIELVESHLLDIVVLVLICYINLLAARNYLDFFGLSEVFHSLREDEAEALYRVFEAPLEVLVKFVIVVLYVMIGQRHSQDDLVESLHKVAI